MRWLRHAVRKIVRQLPHRRGLKSHDPFVIIRHLVKRETPVILDVGAHIGQTSARFRTLFPNARIHAFEPSPAAFTRLSAAVAGDRRIKIGRAHV